MAIKRSFIAILLYFLFYCVIDQWKRRWNTRLEKDTEKDEEDAC